MFKSLSPQLYSSLLSSGNELSTHGIILTKFVEYSSQSNFIFKMVIKEEGHVYELKNFESESSQVLTFIKKQKKSPESDELVTVLEGTTNEEVLEVLIDRLQVLNKKFPSRENSIVITKLEESLLWLNKRTQDRKARGVEGKHIA